MINLLNDPSFDNTRNNLNADLFVSNLKHTFEGFKWNTKITYEVYRTITIYHIKWTDDKEYNDILELKREIAIALGIRTEELKIEDNGNNSINIIVDNMKREPLSLKELLYEFKMDDSFKVPLGLNVKDEVITFDFDKDKSLLVAGVSSSGKTNLFNSIIINLLINYSDTKIVILDSQGINYNSYENICEVVNKEEDIIKKIKSLRKEFEDRVKSGNKDRLVVFIDEIYEIIKIDSSIDEDINYLLEVGSTYGIHLIVSTDSVLEEDTLRIFSNNKIAKLSFYLTSRGEYNTFIHVPVNEDLNNDGMYLDSDSNLNRIIIPLIEDDEIERVVGYIEKR